LHERRHWHDEHAALERRQSIQRGDALRNDLRMRREQVVGQRLPVGELQNFEIVAGEHGDLGLERVRRMRVAREGDDEAVVLARGQRERQRERRTVRCGPVASLFGRGGKGRLDQRRGHRNARRRRWRAGRFTSSGAAHSTSRSEIAGRRREARPFVMQHLYRMLTLGDAARRRVDRSK
jgi:hypothetical protein